MCSWDGQADTEEVWFLWRSDPDRAWALDGSCVWRQDDRYTDVETVKTFRTEKAGWSFLNGNTGENWVLHWVRSGPAEVHQP